MNKDIAMQWADALESGEYKQDRGALRNDDGFCCLGVLCDLFMRDTARGKWCDADAFNVDGDERTAFVPQAVADWAGMAERSGGRRDAKELVPGLPSLTGLNDHGATFPEIAAVIREQWEAL